MSVFLTTFLLLQIILLFLYKSFIVDIAKKNEKNLVENTLQIYPMRRKTPCFSYGDIRRVHRIYASN